jgi:hypothetical protein
MTPHVVQSFHTIDRSRLFDRIGDPLDTRDLSGTETERLASMQSRLLEHLKAEKHADAGDTLPDRGLHFTEADRHNILGWMGYGGVR